MSHICYLEVLTIWSGTGITTAPGTLTLSGWTPSNGYAAADLISGLTLYTNLTIRADHAIPANGVVVLTFASVDIQTPKYNFDSEQLNGTGDSYCYVHYSENYNLSCSLTSATVLELTAPS